LPLGVAVEVDGIFELNWYQAVRLNNT
jgi:hypothetical protein